MLHKLAAASLGFALSLLVGCSTPYEPRETIVDRTQETAVAAKQREIETRAYKEGVRQTLTDFKGKMRARDRFTWQPPIVQCGTRIPSRVVNGALIPSHETCVTISPGHYTEEAPDYVPDLTD